MKFERHFLLFNNDKIGKYCYPTTKSIITCQINRKIIFSFIFFQEKALYFIIQRLVSQIYFFSSFLVSVYDCIVHKIITLVIIMTCWSIFIYHVYRNDRNKTINDACVENIVVGGDMGVYLGAVNDLA